jgi:hypothetical protein
MLFLYIPSPFVLFSGVGGQQTTAEELLVRAEVNGHKRGLHKEQNDVTSASMWKN